MSRQVGATGSGKSFVDYSVTIPKRIISAKDEGLLVLMGNTRGTLERNILEPMRRIWTEHNVGRIKSDNTAMLFGKKCYALGADNKKHVQRIQGASFEYVYGDEVTTWSESVFQMLKSRLRCEHSHFDGTCNPDNPSHWFRQFLDSDADVYQQNYTIEDGVLPETIVEELKKEYAGTVYYDRFILGLWAAATGLIFPMYKQAIVDEIPDVETEKYEVSVDYGTMNPFAAILWELKQGTWYATKGYYYDGRARGIQKTDEDYVNDMIRFTEEARQNSQRKLRVIVDPSAASFITAMFKTKLFSVLRADNAVLDGIRETATAMQTGKIKIYAGIKEWQDEAEKYVWDDTVGEDRPVKENDHCLTGDTLVDTEYGQIAISDLVGKKGRVWSYSRILKRKVLRRFKDVRLTRKNAKIYKVTFADGRIVRCTDEHRFLTKDGWKELKQLTESDYVLSVKG